MQCQNCDAKAVFHFTKIVDSEAEHFHLCEACAKDEKLLLAGHLSPPQLGLPAEMASMSFSAILQTLLGHHLGEQVEELARLTCPACGLKYMEFRAGGRLGCPAEYAAFRAGLEPILEQVHRATRHAGKVPRRRAIDDPTAAELLQLRNQLKAAVESEDYEQAAKLRDEIRQKEVRDVVG